jgi:hypothetical protein
LKKTEHKVLYLRIPPELHDAIKELGEEENRNITNMAETILRRYLEEVGKLPKEAALAS